MSAGRPASDMDDIFACPARSKFRRRFRRGPKERNYLAGKGVETIRGHAAGFVATRLAPADTRNDNRQTPMRGHPVFLAQHATATCCRGCLAKWHGIPQGRPLTGAEQARIVVILMRWIEGGGHGMQRNMESRDGAGGGGHGIP